MKSGQPAGTGIALRAVAATEDRCPSVCDSGVAGRPLQTMTANETPIVRRYDALLVTEDGELWERMSAEFAGRSHFNLRAFGGRIPA